jgi:hypothetical protein
MEKRMSLQEKGAAHDRNVDCPKAITLTQNITEKKPKIQEAIAALKRDFCGEALAIAAVKCSHAADDILLGDDPSAERGIRLAISHLRAAAAAFRELYEGGSQ